MKRPCPYCYRSARKFSVMCDVCRKQLYATIGAKPPSMVKPLLVVAIGILLFLFAIGVI